MAFVKKTWTNRIVEHPSRRKLSPVSGEENTYDVIRAEGTITDPGDAFNADNMNDLENRINTAVNNSLTKGIDATATLKTNETTATFTLNQDLSNTIIDVYTSIYGYSPSEIKANGKILTITFDSAPKEECTVGVKIMGVY